MTASGSAVNFAAEPLCDLEVVAPAREKTAVLCPDPAIPGRHQQPPDRRYSVTWKGCVFACNLTRRRDMSASESLVPDGPSAGILIRPWRDDADFDACAEVLREATAHDGFVRVRDGARWRSTFRQLRGDPARDCWLATVDGEVVAYAMAFDLGREDQSTRLLIHNIVVGPAWRGRQVEHRLMDVATTRLRQNADEFPSASEANVRFSAEINERETYILELLAGRGYSIRHYVVEMARPLDATLPALTLPPGIETRPITGPAVALRVLAALSGAAVEDGMPAFTENQMVEMVAHPIDGQIEHWVVAWQGIVPVACVLGWVDAAENSQQSRARAYTEGSRPSQRGADGGSRRRYWF